jgi:2'-5' RNA ligase
MKKLGFGPNLDTKIYEYLLIIPPSNAVSGKVTKIKIIFSEIHGCKNAAKLTPHLSVINFLQHESMEFRIIGCFEKFTQYINPFPIDLNGFGEFPNHTIYVNLSAAEPVINIVKDMRAKFRHILKISDSLKPKFITRPHLTIARGMTEEQHQTIWPIYKKEHFTDSFIASEMILIKREVEPTTLKPVSKFKVVHHFPFGGKQEGNEQMKLAL